MGFIVLRGFCHQLFAGISASMGGFSITAVYGWVTPILSLLLSTDSEIPMTPRQASWMRSLPHLVGSVFPVPVGLLADRIGRKPMILISAPFFAAGWIIILCLRSYPALLVARFLQGLGQSIALSVIPVYLGEIASTEYRGAITSLFFTFTWIAYLFEYSIGPFLSFTNSTLLTLTTSVLFFLMFMLQPETPYFHLMKGNKTGAFKSIKWLKSTSDDSIKNELEMIESSINEDKIKGPSWLEVIASTTDRKALYILLFVGALRGLCGVTPLVSYATALFETTGVGIPPKYITITLGLVIVIASVLSFFTMDVLGRRPHIIVSCFLSSLCSFVAAAFFFLQSETNIDVSSLMAVPSVLVLMHTGLMVLGVFPVMSAYTSELFNSKTRSFASSINTGITTILSFLQLKIYEDINGIFGVYFNFVIFGVVCLFGAIISYLYLPETKNKTFQDIIKRL